VLRFALVAVGKPASGSALVPTDLVCYRSEIDEPP
jgi:hypothetical protein